MASSECGGKGETYSSAAPFDFSQRAVAASRIAPLLTPSSRSPTGASDTQNFRIRIVSFRSRLHTRPRNSGVVQTIVDMKMSQVPCPIMHSAQ